MVHTYWGQEEKYYWGGSAAGCAREKICFPLLLRLVLVFGALGSSLVLYTDSFYDSSRFSLSMNKSFGLDSPFWNLLIGSLFNWYGDLTQNMWCLKKVSMAIGYALTPISTMSMHLYARVIYAIILWYICDIFHG